MDVLINMFFFIKMGIYHLLTIYLKLDIFMFFSFISMYTEVQPKIEVVRISGPLKTNLPRQKLTFIQSQISETS